MDEMLWYEDAVRSEVFPALQAQGYACDIRVSHADDKCVLEQSITKNVGGGLAISLTKKLTEAPEGWVDTLSAILVQDTGLPPTHPLNEGLRFLSGSSAQAKALGRLLVGHGPVASGAQLTPEMASELGPEWLANAFLELQADPARQRRVLQAVRIAAPMLEFLGETAGKGWRVVMAYAEPLREALTNGEKKPFSVVLGNTDDRCVEVGVTWTPGGPVSARAFLGARPGSFRDERVLESSDELVLPDGSSPLAALAHGVAWMESNRGALVERLSERTMRHNVGPGARAIVAASNSELRVQLTHKWLDPATNKRKPKTLTISLTVANGKVTGVAPAGAEIVARLCLPDFGDAKPIENALKTWGQRVLNSAEYIRTQMFTGFRPQLSAADPKKVLMLWDNLKDAADPHIAYSDTSGELESHNGLADALTLILSRRAVGEADPCGWQGATTATYVDPYTHALPVLAFQAAAEVAPKKTRTRAKAFANEGR
ncbi:hypothetical protein [Ramlibacter alkalitolerans]|uniref:Uncharacterized protein n=1 Tax=Ramlibacter alkalitolerans TaxID=2039631 RepID=A0ABS1JU13_9BURK|nr:hypothetical protein [Ramlibacter alkalitolerans]MBL0427724.1 hypothetical protein [Ramlibacter alkalitolerans]